MSDETAAGAGEKPGDVLGRYKLLEQIGEGGMGSVWMAEQREPVRRRVALKVIKLGMDTKQVIARFEAERQALALMDHPNIAKVLDAGSTGSGRPYFVMEYIKGVPIVEYCDRERLDTRSRLELFTSVCQAIQHAHHKGIIHRDIKPGNVLVTLHDGVPVPKVIDFGIAKATSAELTTKTLFTEHRQMLGTPAYMSPEQAEMSGLDIDTRTDVYSLGVLLYELLTGTTPFDIKTLLASGFGEMVRAIREDEPHKPSTRISSLGDTGTRTAEQRRVDLRKLSVLLRGDLDWIVMKCLEKDRTRRYETASALAADVRRHLFDEPVTAGPPNAGYRLRKFVRRHRGRVIAAGAVLAVLVLGVTGTTAGMLWANDEAERAEAARSRATTAARNESEARARAQENERSAVEAAQRAAAAAQEEGKARRRADIAARFVVTALRSGDPEQAGGGQDTTVLAAMDNAIADIDSGRFADDPVVEADLRLTIGAILRNNGRLREAETILAKSLETARRLDSPNLAMVMNELALAKSALGRKDEAREMFRAAVERDQRHFKGDHAALSRGMVNLAATLPPEEAEPLLRKALAMDRRLSPGDSADVSADLGNLGSLLFVRGRAAEAEPLLAESLGMLQRMHPGDHPYTAKALDNLGKVRLALARASEAEELLTQALAMRRRLFKQAHPDLATGLNNLAYLLMEQGRLTEADGLFAEALEVRRRLFPGDDFGTAEVMRRLAGLRIELDRADRAEPLAVDVLAMSRRLRAGDHADTVIALTVLATAVAAQGRTAEAMPLLVEAQEMSQRLPPKEDPDTAIRLDNLGKAFQRVGRLSDAETLLAQALALRERIYEGDNPDLAKGLNNLAGAIAARGRIAEALAMERRSLEMYQRMFGRDDPRLAQVLDTFATMLRDAGRPAEAEPYAVKAVELSQRPPAADSPRAAMALYNLGIVREMLGRREEAGASFEKATQMMQRLLPADHPNVLFSRERFAENCYWLGQYDRAIAEYADVLKVRQERQGPRHPDTIRTMADLGANLRSAKRSAEAIPLLEEAHRESQGDPRIVGVVAPHLLTAYGEVADPGDPKSVAETAARGAALLGRLRSSSSETDLARYLTVFGLELLRLRAWDAAEPLVREALEIRKRRQPNEWTTFNTESVMGEILLSLGRHSDAEPLLLSGCRGIKARAPLTDPNVRMRFGQAVERLVRLYEATGNAVEAAAWRKELDGLRAAGGGGR